MINIRINTHTYSKSVSNQFVICSVGSVCCQGVLSQNICQGLGLNLGHPKTLGLASCALAPDHQHPQHPTMGPCDGGYAWMMIYKCSNGKNLIELVMSETSMDNMVHAL